MKTSTQILTEAEIEQIESQALRILSDVGIKVYNQELRHKAKQAGLVVDDEVVRIPPEIVRWAIGAAPREWCLYGRNGSRLPLTKGNCHLSTYADGLFVLDYRASEPRPSTEQDLVDFVRLGQAANEIAIVGPVCYARDYPEPVQLLHTAKVVMLHSDKHINIGPLNLDEARTWYELAEIASPGIDQQQTPTLSIVVSPTSPLQFDQDTSQVFTFAVEKKIPFLACSCPMAGGSSPLSLVGTIVLHLAEDLFLLALAQLLQEGTPVILAGAAGIMDVRKGALSYGAPERNLLLGAMIDIADYYHLPHHSPAGSVDSWYPDIQTGAHKMQTWMARKASGVILGIGFGSLLTGKVVSREQFLIDIDLWHMTERYFEGLDLSRLAEAFQVIQRVGHGGSYLADEQTFELMRAKEIYLSDLVNLEGSQRADMWERAHHKVERGLASHLFKPQPDISEAIERFVAEKEKFLRR